MDNIKVTGIYTAEKKYELVWLKNAQTNLTQSIDYFKFEKILLQAFTEKQIKIILEEINCMRKVILDFDKGVAKRIVDKDPDFLEAMKPYFDAKKIQQRMDDPFTDDPNFYEQEKGEYF